MSERDDWHKWEFFAVKNWRKFQHYTDRRPPWIKLHNEILDDHTFTKLTDRDKGCLVLIWLLASRLDNRIPNDPKWIRYRIGLERAPNLGRFVEDGFLIEWKSETQGIETGVDARSDASKPQAEREQSAIPEAEAETEAEEDASSAKSFHSGNGRIGTPPTPPLALVEKLLDWEPSFEDLDDRNDYGDAKVKAGEIVNRFTRETIAKLWAACYERNPEVTAETVLKAVNKIYSRDYNRSRRGKEPVGNWPAWFVKSLPSYIPRPGGPVAPIV